MRHLLIFALLASLALFPGCNCGGKSSSSSSSSSSSPSPEPIPLPPPVRVGPDGGTIERGKAKLEIPKGSLALEQDIRFDEIRTAMPQSYKAAGPAFYFSAEQAMFWTPLKVTLPLDSSRLPADVKPEHIEAVFAFDGFGEVLDEPPPKVDLAAGTVTVLVTRTFPLASGDAGGAGGGPVLQASVNPGGIDMIEVTPKLRWRAAHGLDKAQEMVERGKAIMKLVRKSYDPLGLPDPGQLTITFKPMNPAWGGLCTGPNSFEINSDKFLGDSLTKERAEYFGKSQGGTFMHEYFHCLQNKMFQHSTQSLTVPLRGDYFLRGKTSWIKEATATWMQEFMSGAGAESNLSRLKPDFCYKPLNVHEEDVPNPHQYAAYIFFSWIDTLYPAKQVIIRTFQELCSGTWVKQADLEADSGQGRGTFNPLDILDRILLGMTDNQGRTRGLRDVYADFLMHYAWLKDFAPVQGDAVKGSLGAAREIILPGDRTTAWTLPADESGTIVSKKSETVAGEGFHIARAFMITKGLKSGEKGDLRVTVKGSRGRASNESMVIVFPLKQNAEPPELGTAEQPAVLRNFQDTNGAIVWLVDLSVTGDFALTLTAEIKQADGIQFELQGQPPREPFTENMTSTYFFVNYVPPAGMDVKSEAGKKQWYELSDTWAKTLEKERGDRRQWVHVEVTVGGGRTQHFYGGAQSMNAPAFAAIPGKLLLPRKPGNYTVEAKAKIRGQTITVSYPITVKFPDWRQPATDDSIRMKLKELEELKAKNGTADSISRVYLSLGGLYACIWKDDYAIEAWKAGMALAPDEASRNNFVLEMGENAYQRGDVDTYLAARLKTNNQVNYEDCARWVLALENNRKKAKELRSKVPGIREDDLERFREWPNEGDEILE